MKTLQYSGTRLAKPVQLKGSETLKPYIPDDALVRAVNLALLLEKPLLLMGEPGCGKSLLAKSLAYELYGASNKDWMTDLYAEWNIKSTTEIKEGLYIFDHLERLQDAQLGNSVGDLKKYVRYGAIDRAFRNSTSRTQRLVLLIDEIDKADIDFPNDLLIELDRYEYRIPELGNVTVKAKYPPIIIITSNSEKDLPDAFLRRCLFHYIEPLGREKLKLIIESRFYPDAKKDTKLIDKALNKYLSLRAKVQSDPSTYGKSISTSEFLDWYQALHLLSQEAKGRDKEDVTKLLAQIQKLDDTDVTSVPFGSLLFKNMNSFLSFNKETT